MLALPSSLGSAILALLHASAAVAASSNYSNAASTTSSESSTDVGALILQGLGASSTSASSTSTRLGTGLQYSVAASETDQPDHVTFTTTVSQLGNNTVSLTQALTCWSEFLSWKSSSIAFKNSVIANKTWPVTSYTTVITESWNWASTIYPANVSTYKLCDGSPRVNIRPATTRYSTVSADTATFTDLATPTYSVPQPCIPTEDDCMLLYEQSNISWYNADINGQCGFPAHLMQHGRAPCIFQASGAVRLFYFPVETANGSLCAPSRSTVTQMPTGAGPNVVTVDGHTFTSGSAYVSIQSLYAYFDGFNVTIGPTFTNLLLTMQSTDVSTQCSGMTNMTQLNYGDLNWPVPASAYACQDRCWYQSEATRDPGFPNYQPFPTQCATIWSDVNPDLAIPTKVLKSMVPEWASCVAGDGNQPNYWFDPPKALQQTDVEASVTVPSAYSSTPAAPSSTPPSPMAESTTPPAFSGSTTSSAGATSAQQHTSSGSAMSQLKPADSNSVTSSPGSSADPDSTTQGGQPADPTSPQSTTSADPVPTMSSSAPSMDPARSSSSADTAHSMYSSSDPVDPEQSSTSSHGTTDPTAQEQTTAQPQWTAAAISILAAALSSSTGPQANSVTGDPAMVSDDQSSSHVSSGLPQTMTLSPISTDGAGNSVFAAGSITITASDASGYNSAVEVDGQTLAAGGAAVTISGQVLSQGSSGLVVVGSDSTAVFTYQSDHSGTTTSSSSVGAGSSSASNSVASPAVTLTQPSPSSGTGPAAETVASATKSGAGCLGNVRGLWSDMALIGCSIALFTYT